MMIYFIIFLMITELMAVKWPWVHKFISSKWFDEIDTHGLTSLIRDVAWIALAIYLFCIEQYVLVVVCAFFALIWTSFQYRATALMSEEVKWRLESQFDEE